VLDVPEDGVGSCIERLGQRRGEMQDMQVGGNGRTHGVCHSARGLVGFRGIHAPDEGRRDHEPQLPRLPPDQWGD